MFPRLAARMAALRGRAPAESRAFDRFASALVLAENDPALNARRWAAGARLLQVHNVAWRKAGDGKPDLPPAQLSADARGMLEQIEARLRAPDWRVLMRLVIEGADLDEMPGDGSEALERLRISLDTVAELLGVR